MVYLEIKERNGNKYYYRTLSARKNGKISKKRVYLGANLSEKSLLVEKEKIKNIQLKNLEEIKSRILKVLRKNHVIRAGIFGSYARGQQKKGSDVDILVEPKESMGLQFVTMKLELEDVLKKRVDLITYKSIHPLLKEKILREEIKIL